MANHVYKQSLFDQEQLTPTPKKVPLAESMRPQSLDEIVGQDDVIGPDSSFGRILRTPDMAIPSVLLWGPPGTGKTTIARVIAKSSDYRFVRLSGVLDGVKDLRDAVKEAETELSRSGKQTLALVDEIHRFNRSQQDAFLPHAESGLLTVIGQTTENVSFKIRNALLSRMRVIEISPIGIKDLGALIDRALKDKDRGLGVWEISIEDEAREFLAKAAGGDARRALTGLEWAASDAKMSKNRVITEQIAKDSYGNQPMQFDQSGDYHYDFISAFIKSMRGSDPDAALFYMIRALDGGEDPLFLTRRMIIFASEDCSCDPRALEVAINVDRAVERVGLPEARISLAHGAVYLSCCSKSNASYKALRKMETIVADNPTLKPPREIRNAPTELMKDMGNAEGYQYPHNYEGAFVPIRYLPEELKDLKVYEPTDRGLDAQIAERLKHYDRLIKQSK